MNHSNEISILSYRTLVDCIPGKIWVLLYHAKTSLSVGDTTSHLTSAEFPVLVKPSVVLDFEQTHVTRTAMNNLKYVCFEFLLEFL